MSRPVEQIKERLSIVDCVSSYVELEQSGMNYKARCPFHNEKTPSFFVSPERNSYYCFGCGAKGDIFSFVEQFEGVDFRGALRILAERTGVSLDQFPREERDEKTRIYEAMEEAAHYFELLYAKNVEARAYLLNRGLKDETIKNFRIGYAPDVWRSVSVHLISKGFTENVLEAAGLIKKGDKGFYDRFRGRIMFPISDSSGRIIAFSGRIFGKEDEREAKYLNSPDTILFNKSNVLFGIDKAKNQIRIRGYTIIVEGQIDLLMSHQGGFSNTVAVSGTALADHTEGENSINNLGLVRRLSPNVIFAYDGDEAGARAAGRSALIAMSLDMQVKLAQLPYGKDPADILKENPDLWKEIIRNAKNPVTFFLERILATVKDERMIGKAIREIVFPYIYAVRSAIEQATYIREIHSRTSIPENAIVTDFEFYKKMHASSEIAEPVSVLEAKEREGRKSILEKKILGILIVLKSKNIDIATVSLSENELTLLFSRYDASYDTLAFETEMWYGNNTEAMLRDAKELGLNLEEETLLESRREIMKDISNQKLSEIQKINKRLEEIQNKRSQ